MCCESILEAFRCTMQQQKVENYSESAIGENDGFGIFLSFNRSMFLICYSHIMILGNSPLRCRSRSPRRLDHHDYPSE